MSDVGVLLARSDLNPNPWDPGDTVTIRLIFEYDDPEPTRPDSLYASYIGGDEVRLHWVHNATQQLC